MSTDVLWLTEADVVEMVDMGDTIAALDDGLKREGKRTAQNMVKTHVLWGKGSTLHATGAVFEDSGFSGTKTWTNTELGSTPIFLLFSAEDGTLKAVIEASALGQLRTGGITGVGTKWTARSNAHEMLLIGTGKQAMTQLAAVAAVRRLDRVLVWGRNLEKRDAFIARARSVLGLQAEPASSIADACRQVDIVTVVTRAREPIVTGAMLRPGTHLNAVGAITPERTEFEPALLDRATLMVVDSIPQVQNLSSEFRAYFAEDPSGWSRVKSLSEIVAAGRSPGEAGGDLTVFKSMGMGLADLSLGVELYKRATARGIGRTLPQPKKVAPRLTSRQDALT